MAPLSGKSLTVTANPPALRVGFEEVNIFKSILTCRTEGRVPVPFFARSSDISIGGPYDDVGVAHYSRGFNGNAKIALWVLSEHMLATELSLEIPCEYRRPTLADYLTDGEKRRVMESLSRDKIADVEFRSEFEKRAEQLLLKKSQAATNHQ